MVLNATSKEGIIDKLITDDVLSIGSNIQAKKGFLSEKRTLFHKQGEEIALSYKGSAQENLIGVIMTVDEKIVELEDKFERFGTILKTHAENVIVVDEIAKNAIGEE